MPKISAGSIGEHRVSVTDRLLDAYGQLVRAKGYEGVSLADVAAAAGLARTAIYNYFPDRESLLFAWTDREVERTLSELEQRVRQAPTGAEKIRVFVRLELESFTASHLPPSQEVIHFLGPDTYKRFMNHIEPVEKLLREILEDGVEAGDFTDVDPEAMIPMVLACVGAERAPLTTGEHDLDEATERVASFLLRALGAATQT
jgi:AcrR family transcriptional regulator